MLKIGIVAEYNPFHNGHLYQIRKIKEIFGKDVLIVVVISGDFVQRGEISFLDKWEKTQVSLGCGVATLLFNSECWDFFKDGDKNFGLFWNRYSGFWSGRGKYWSFAKGAWTAEKAGL